MPQDRRHSRVALVACAAAVLACGEPPVRKGDVTPADAIAGRAQTVEHFESARGKFVIDFPQAWRGGYSAVEHADTTAGATFAVEFVFKPDAAWKVPARTLMVVRIFPRAAWDRLVARPGPAIAAKVAERGDDVFALSLPPSNPYKAGTPAAARFDEIVLSVAQDPALLRLTPH